MDFSSISNMNSYLKTMNMNHIWKQKENNPAKSVISSSTSKASQETYERASSPIDERYMSIIAKMKSGQKLSSEDMDYLREKYPADYDEVKKMAEEKKEFEKELSRCKTKSDARMLHQGKITEAFAALKGGAVSAEVIMAKLSIMTESFTKFTESKHFSKLAENHAELAEAIEAEKAAITGKSESSAAEQENMENDTQPAEDVHEPQDQSVESEKNSDFVGDGTPVPQSTHDGNPKPANTGSSPTSALKVKTDAISADTKPSFIPNKAAVKASNQAYSVDVAVDFSHSKLNRQV